MQSGRNLQTIADSEVDPEGPFDENSANLPKYYDILGFDPRGVNNTTPGFNCFPNMFSRRNWELQKEAEGMLGSSEDSLVRNWQRNKGLASGCSKQISTGTDGQEALGEHMNTSPVVQDMIEIIERHAEWREKQGVAQQQARNPGERFNKKISLARRTRRERGNERLLFWGRSYGTVLGATFAAMYPDRVERAVLDGVVDLDSYYLSTGPSSVVDADAVFDRFAMYCDAAGSDGCGLYRPGGPDSIRTAVRALLSSIRDSPIAVPASATRGPEVVSWTDVMVLLRIAMYQPLYVFPLVAELLATLSMGNGSAMADFKQRHREPSCLSSECLLSSPYSQECTRPGENDEYATAAILCTDAENLRKVDMEQFKQGWDALKASSEMLGDYWASELLTCAGWKAKAKWRFTGVNTANDNFHGKAMTDSRYRTIYREYFSPASFRQHGA
jgi:pimeloyl-ACP methyl ester carboxylesterase